MKSNWKVRNKQYNDRIRGEMFDVGIGYGLELASVVLNHHFGFGAKRLYKLNLEALRYIASIKDGAKEFTEEYKNNVEYASIKMHKEFDKVMALKNNGVDYGQKLRDTIDSGSYLNLEIEEGEENEKR